MFFILQNTAKYVTFQRKSHKRLHFAPSHIFSRKNLLHIKCIQRGYQKKVHNSIHGDEHKIPPLSTSVTTTPDTDQTLSSAPSSYLWALFRQTHTIPLTTKALSQTIRQPWHHTKAVTQLIVKVSMNYKFLIIHHEKYAEM